LRQTSDEAARSSAGPQKSIALKNILVLTDLSDGAKNAVNYAVELAEHFGAKLTLLYIDTTLYLEAYFGGSYGYPALRLHSADNLEALDELGQQIKGRYANSETCFRCGNFCEEIVHAAIALDAHLIVLCTQHYKWINRLGGKSYAEDVLRRAPRPVLIVHDDERDFVVSEA
jgi:nucleotide-binding universal stress UspA family protein